MDLNEAISAKRLQLAVARQRFLDLSLELQALEDQKAQHAAIDASDPVSYFQDANAARHLDRTPAEVDAAWHRCLAGTKPL